MHTKGPLKVTFNIPIGVDGGRLTMGHHIRTDDDVERTIATLWEGGGMKGKPTQIAYAHLFKAAPDMLEALEEIANHKQDSFTMTHSCEHDPMENYYDVKEIAGSAIRKAKGE